MRTNPQQVGHKMVAMATTLPSDGTQNLQFMMKYFKTQRSINFKISKYLKRGVLVIWPNFGVN